MQAYKHKVQRDFSEAALGYHTKAQWQKGVALELLARFQGDMNAPLLDVGAGTGFIAEALQQRLSSITQIDIALDMCKVARAFSPAAVMDMECLGARSNHFQTVTSSLALQWASSAQDAFDEIFRVLKPKGVFLFSTLTKNTLAELRETMGRNKVLAFHDAAEIQALLTASGFTHIEIEVVKNTREYADYNALLADIKQIGARHKSFGSTGLSGRAQLKEQSKHYAQHYACNKGVYATWEIVFGRAVKPL